MGIGVNWQRKLVGVGNIHLIYFEFVFVMYFFFYEIDFLKFYFYMIVIV
jgi:hypothetical protein